MDRKKLKRQNALNAIPKSTERYLSGNQIHNRQETPRLPREELYPLLERLAHSKQIDSVSAGYMRYYRQWEEAPTIAPGIDGPYNQPQRNKFSLNADVDLLFQTIYPIRKGKVVLLWLNLPVKPTDKKTTKKLARRLVVISPGHTIGLTRGVVLVSVVGSGSSLVRPLLGEGSADLVLAGMPARLAKILMNVFHRVLKE